MGHWVLCDGGAFRLVLSTVASEKGADADPWLDEMKAILVHDYKMRTATEGISYSAEADAGQLALNVINFIIEAARHDVHQAQGRDGD